MKRSTKAVQLSAFIFPGLILIGASLASTYYIVSKTVEESLQIVEHIQSGNVQPDVASIEELMSKQSTGADAYLLDIATYIFITCWLIGIIDSYRVGRARDKDIVI